MIVSCLAKFQESYTCGHLYKISLEVFFFNEGFVSFGIKKRYTISTRLPKEFRGLPVLVHDLVIRIILQREIMDTVALWQLGQRITKFEGSLNIWEINFVECPKKKKNNIQRVFKITIMHVSFTGIQQSNVKSRMSP